MAGIVIPHQSQQAIQTANAGQAAQYRSASAFMTPGQENLGRGMQQLAAGMDKLNGVLFQAELHKRQEQMDLTLLQDMQNFRAESDAWSDNYRQQNQGENALNAEVDAKGFYDDRLNQLRTRWRGNNAALSYIEKQAGSLAINGIDSMRDYGFQQQDKWKDSIFQGEMATFMATASDPKNSPEFIREEYQKVAPQFASYFQKKGLDPTATMVKIESLYREGMASNFFQRLSANPEEALRVLDGKPQSVTLPREVDPVAKAAAEASGVDLDLIRAVISAESAGNAGAVSPVGARGLMQLMPETQKELEGRYGIDGSTPEGNVQLGSRYLKELLQRYDGDQRLALMAYNWGMGNVDSFIDHGRGRKTKSNPTGAIPRETQKYVNKILGEHDALAREVLTPVQQEKLRVMAEVGSADSLSEQLYQHVAAGNLSEAQAREQIADIDNRKVRSAARQAFAERMQIAKAQEREDILVAGEQAYDAISGIASAEGKSEAEALSEMYTLRKEAEIKAHTGSKADKAYSKALNDLYANAISGQQFGLKTNPASFLKATDGITNGTITSTQQLKASCPEVASADMKKLETMLTGAQKVDIAAINRHFRIFEGMEEGDSVQGERQTRLAGIQQTIIDAAKETNRGNDPEWIKGMVAQAFLKGETKGFLWDPDTTFDKARTAGKEFFPDISEDNRQRIADIFSNAPAIQSFYLDKYDGNRNYAYRAWYLHEQEAALLPLAGPPRPADVPSGAEWNPDLLGWVHNGKLRIWGGQR